MTGPPSTIKQMMSSSHCSSLAMREVAASGPYHAEHARSLPKIQEISCSSDADVVNFFNSYEQDLPLVAMNIYSPADGSTPSVTLLENIVDRILYAVSRNPDTTNAAVRHLDTLTLKSCQIVNCSAPRWHDQLCTSLQRDTVINVTGPSEPKQQPQPGPSIKTPTSGKSKLAIVGMAGRFPDSASHEKLWELLYAGLDSHRNVSSFIGISFFFTRMTDSSKRYQTTDST